MTGSLHICILGDPTLWRLGLQALLTDQPRLATVTQAPNPTEVIEPPDVFLLDSRTADDILTAVLTSFPQVHLLIIADDLPEAKVLNWLTKGVLGCIERDAPLPELLNAIRQIALGEASLPQALARRLLGRITHQPPVEEPALLEPLSAREQKVLILLAQGLSNKAIAQRLYLSVRTVEGHLANIYGKLTVHSRTEAALYAARQGWVSPA